MIRLLICGSRTLEGTDSLPNMTKFITNILDKLDITKVECLITGMARGADKIGMIWALNKDIEIIQCPADWSQGKKAGILRNIEMLTIHKPTHVLAFIDKRDSNFPSTGTKHMINISEKAGVPVKVIEVN